MQTFIANVGQGRDSKPRESLLFSLAVPAGGAIQLELSRACQATCRLFHCNRHAEENEREGLQNLI